MSAMTIDPDTIYPSSIVKSLKDIEDTINELVEHYRQELDSYACEMIENGMPTSIICKDLRTYRQDIGE